MKKFFLFLSIFSSTICFAQRQLDLKTQVLEETEVCRKVSAGQVIPFSRF